MGKSEEEQNNNSYYKTKGRKLEPWEKLPITRRTGITRNEMPDKSYQDQERFKFKSRGEMREFADDYLRYENDLKAIRGDWIPKSTRFEKVPSNIETRNEDGSVSVDARPKFNRIDSEGRWTMGGSATEDAVAHYENKMAKRWGDDWKDARLPQLKEYQKLEKGAKNAFLGSYTNQDTKKVTPAKKHVMSDKDRNAHNKAKADFVASIMASSGKEGGDDYTTGGVKGMSYSDRANAAMRMADLLMPDTKQKAGRIKDPSLPSDPETKAMRYRFGSKEDIQQVRNDTNAGKAQEYVDAFKSSGWDDAKKKAFIARLSPDMQKAVGAASEVNQEPEMRVSHEVEKEKAPEPHKGWAGAIPRAIQGVIGDKSASDMADSFGVNLKSMLGFRKPTEDPEYNGVLPSPEPRAWGNRQDISSSMTRTPVSPMAPQATQTPVSQAPRTPMGIASLPMRGGPVVPQGTQQEYGVNIEPGAMAPKGQPYDAAQASLDPMMMKGEQMELMQDAFDIVIGAAKGIIDQNKANTLLIKKYFDMVNVMGEKNARSAIASLIRKAGGGDPLQNPFGPISR